MSCPAQISDRACSALDAVATSESGLKQALEVLGGGPSLLVLSEIAAGVVRFTDLHERTGLSRGALTIRLHQLIEAGVIGRHPYSNHPRRFEYSLTDTGAALRPALAELSRWGQRYRPQLQL